MSARLIVLACIVILYLILGVIDLSAGTWATGLASILLAFVNLLLFIQ